MLLLDVRRRVRPTDKRVVNLTEQTKVVRLYGFGTCCLKQLEWSWVVLIGYE
uniref:Uncharacterized protein n=1 Tax=Helianthus annuus TaxID=4232 RepID=A0A1Y3BUH1_HELAN